MRGGLTGTRGFYSIIGVALVMLALTLVYYEMSYSSVNNTIVQLVSGERVSTANSVSAFDVNVYVWSTATSLETHLYSPSFNLTVDSIPFGSLTPGDGTWQIGGLVSYKLEFRNANDTVQRMVSLSSTNRIVLSMSGVVSAGLYTELISRTAFATWTFG